MPNYKLTLQYDGSRYRGWQRLPNTELTIQGKLEAVLSRIFDAPVAVSGSGRTDAGVHAIGQVASFRTDADLPPERGLAALRQYLPEDIGAVRLEYARRASMRGSRRGKTYRYRVWNSDEPCVFERRWVYVFPDALDRDRMQQAAVAPWGPTISAPSPPTGPKKSTVRTLTALELSRVGRELRFTLTGDGFLYRMVRILVGTLLEIGRGERSIESIEEIFAGRTRAEAGFTVPAKGLCLMEVQYP